MSHMVDFEYLLLYLQNPPRDRLLEAWDRYKRAVLERKDDPNQKLDQAMQRIDSIKNSHSSKAKLKPEHIVGVIPIRLSKVPLRARFASTTSFYSYTQRATLQLELSLPKTFQYFSAGCLYLHFNHSCYDLSHRDISSEIKNAIDQEDGTLGLTVSVDIHLATVVPDNVLKLLRVDLQLQMYS